MNLNQNKWSGPKARSIELSSGFVILKENMSALSKLPVVAESLQNQLKLELTLYFNCRFRGDRYFAFRINGQQLCPPSISFPYEGEGDDAFGYFSSTFDGIMLENFISTVVYFDMDGVQHCPVLIELPMSARDKIPIICRTWMDKAGKLVWVSEISIKILLQNESEDSECPLFLSFNSAGLTYPEGLQTSLVLKNDIRRGRIIV